MCRKYTLYIYTPPQRKQQHPEYCYFNSINSKTDDKKSLDTGGQQGTCREIQVSEQYNFNETSYVFVGRILRVNAGNSLTHKFTSARQIFLFPTLSSQNPLIPRRYTEILFRRLFVWLLQVCDSKVLRCDGSWTTPPNSVQRIFQFWQAVNMSVNTSIGKRGNEQLHILILSQNCLM